MILRQNWHPIGRPAFTRQCSQAINWLCGVSPNELAGSQNKGPYLRQLASFLVGDGERHAVTFLHHARTDVRNTWTVTRRNTVVVKDTVYRRPFEANRDFKEVRYSGVSFTRRMDSSITCESIAKYWRMP